MNGTSFHSEEPPAVTEHHRMPQSLSLKIAARAHGAKYRKVNSGPAYAWPMGGWFTLFFVAPLLIIVAYSFMKRDVYGGVVREFTLKAYSQMFTSAYGMIFLRTLWITVVSTFATIMIALPCGYAMARSRHQTLLLILVIVPFLTNSLIRIFAWMTILGDNGLLNTLCGLCFKIWNALARHPEAEFKPIKFMFTQGAVILVSIYMYLPYAILPIFTAVDRFDFSLLEAARDLGATKLEAVLKVLIPGVKTGIVSALIFTFIPIFGTYTVPQLVGGKDSYMLGNIIVDQVQKVRNWPLASAFSMVITVVSMFAILWMIASNQHEAKLREISTKEELANGPAIASAINSVQLSGGAQ